MSKRDTTGGLRWHWRAFLQRRRWAATSAQIADWLDGTQPASTQLLLIGGSAGWMMSSRWLQRFSEIILVDIDPWAPRLFRVNHGRSLRASGTALRFIEADGLQQLEALLAQFPQASLFFDNVLGQHLYRVREIERAEAELDRIALRLHGRDWGSVHDLLSGPIAHDLPAAVMPLCQSAERAESPPEGGVHYRLNRRLTSLDALGQQLLQGVDAEGIWQDHCTGVVFPNGTAVQFIPWSFKPRYCHWLELGWIRS